MSHIWFQESITSKHSKKFAKNKFGEILIFDDVDSSNFGSRIVFCVEKLSENFLDFIKIVFEFNIFTKFR